MDFYAARQALKAMAELVSRRYWHLIWSYQMTNNFTRPRCLSRQTPQPAEAKTLVIPLYPLRFLQ
jgi:hypothetical protein